MVGFWHSAALAIWAIFLLKLDKLPMVQHGMNSFLLGGMLPFILKYGNNTLALLQIMLRYKLDVGWNIMPFNIAEGKL